MNHLIQAGSLFGRCEAGAPQRPRRLGGNRAGGPAPKAGNLALAEREVLGQFHADELRGDVQHKRRVELAAVRRTVRLVEVPSEVEVKDVHGEHACATRAQGGEGFLMGVVSVRRKNNEGAHAALLPRAQQIIHPAVQGLAADRGIAGIATFSRRVDAIRDCRRPQNTEAGGKVVGEALDDECIASKREVRPMLLAGTHRHQQP